MTDDLTDRRGLFRQMLGGAAKVAAETSSVFDSLGSAAEPERGDEGGPGPAPPSRSPAGRLTATLHETQTAARRSGLESRLEPFSSSVRESINLTPGQASGGGVTIGGHPRLPAGHSWPNWDGRALTFLAQIDLSSVPLAETPASMPDRLLFFWDTMELPSGSQAAHRGSGSVLALPDSSDTEWVVQGQPAHASVELVIPRAWGASVEALDLADAEQGAWEETRRWLADTQGTELTDDLPSDHIVHRVFGYPDNTGGDMPLICELGSCGFDTPKHPFSHPEAPGLNERAARWELLAQFSADEAFGWSWGKVTERLYFWIDRDALAAGDFSHIWTVVR